MSTGWRVVAGIPVAARPVRQGVFATLSALAALMVLTGCAFSGEIDALESVGAEDGSGEVCVPVGEDGFASISHETVRNTSETDVTISDIHATSDEIEVVEWFLTRNDWPDAGVRSSALPDPGEFKLAASVPPQEIALIAVTVKSSNDEDPVQTDITVAYDSDDKTGLLSLNWSVVLVPAGTSCNDHR